MHKLFAGAGMPERRAARHTHARHCYLHHGLEVPTAVPRRVLVLSQNIENSRVIEDATQPWMFETVVCSSLEESRRLLDREDFVLVFCEDGFEGGAYRDLLSQSQRPRRVPVVIMISGADRDAVFQDAMALGAFGVVGVPCSRKDVQWMVIRATHQGQSRRSAR